MQPRRRHRYIQNRFIPDKAIGLVDEAAARLEMEVESVPLPIDERERKRKITRLEIERQARAFEHQRDEARKALKQAQKAQETFPCSWQ